MWLWYGPIFVGLLAILAAVPNAKKSSSFHHVSFKSEIKWNPWWAWLSLHSSIRTILGSIFRWTRKNPVKHGPITAFLTLDAHGNKMVKKISIFNVDRSKSHNFPNVFFDHWIISQKKETRLYHFSQKRGRAL